MLKIRYNYGRMDQTLAKILKLAVAEAEMSAKNASQIIYQNKNTHVFAHQSKPTNYFSCNQKILYIYKYLIVML